MALRDWLTFWRAGPPTGDTIQIPAAENVVCLVPPPAGAPGVVITLETLLAQARRGEIIGLAVAGCRPEGRIFTVYRCGPDDVALMGAISTLSVRYNNEVMQ